VAQPLYQGVVSAFPVHDACSVGLRGAPGNETDHRADPRHAGAGTMSPTDAIGGMTISWTAA